MLSPQKRIPIKRDWDAQPHIQERKGYHVTRTKERELLIDFITRRSEGSLLISGKRGVGKSSVIFSAVQDSKEKTKKNETIIPVLVIAPSFEIHDGNQQIQSTEFPNFKKLIFQTLIRRLYKPGSDELKKEDKNLKSDIEKLYTKAVAQEVIKEIKNTEFTLESTSTIRSSNLNVDHKSIGVLLAFALSAGIFSVLPLTSHLGFTQYLISLGIGAVPTIVYSFKKSTIKTNQDVKKFQAQDYYRHDYSISNIQVDLEETLKKIAQSKYKTVFVIDELDKMSPTNVMSVVRSLKSLVTHGYAIFIFVTGTEFFAQMEESSKVRSPDYTLFTHRIFLQRPLFNEMEQFIDGILDVDEKSLTRIKADSEYRNFRNYLCYQSKVDFFDLNHVLRDHIVAYDNQGRSLLDCNMNKTQITFARLQKAMGQVYSRKAYIKPSDWQKNDSLLERLYWFLEQVTSINPGINFTINRGDKMQLTFPNSTTYEIKDEVEASAISDLFDHLVRLSYLDYIPPNTVRIIGTIDEVPKSPTDVISKEEREFIDESTKFQELVVRYYSMMMEDRN